MRRSHIYTIPAHKPFVDTLAAYAMQHYGADPLALSQLLILLPSRRACRSLREAFLRITDGKPLLLPRMQPIGDVEEDELLLTSFFDETTAAELANLPPAIPPTRRLLLLTRLVWQAQGGENLEQAMHLAQELMLLLDEVAREQLPLENLKHIVPEEFARHWQLTLDFMRILTEHWPKLLEEESALEPVARRNKLLAMLSAQWQQHPPKFPVIAAGSTGSIPATAELLKTIASMEQGMVVLPGWDIFMPAAVRERIASSHPQYGMMALLQHIGCDPREVDVLEVDTIKGASPQRSHFLNLAMLPAEATHEWQKNIPQIKEGLEGLQVITAASLREEAQITALILRSVLEKEGESAALVTHDRSLARRVAAELKRYGVEVDDSAGIPLSDTPLGTYLCLLADMAFAQAAPVPLLALLKHPLSGGGMALPQFRDGVREIELAFLRGVRMETGMEALVKAVQHHPDLSRDARAIIKNVAKICAPLLALMQKKNVPLDEILPMHFLCAEQLATTDEVPGSRRLWDKDIGETLATFVAGMQEAAPLMGEINPAFYPGLFALMLEDASWRPKYGKHPRLHILSPIEARLQHYNVMVLGGLNEGSWPPAAHADAWMNRSMRAEFGLPAPERMLGLAAHDFVTLASAPVCYLTRASKVEGAPSEPSPWLLRLRALLEGQGQSDIFDNAAQTIWHRWVDALNTSEQKITLLPPAPMPPVNARPTAFSVTQIETLMRDPYAIYAKKILGLYLLDPIDADPDVAEFGNVVHKALETFTKQYPTALPENAMQELLRHGQKAFANLLDKPAVYSFWWPRFERIAEWFLEQEKERRGAGVSIYAESHGKMQIEAAKISFTLSARIDRIEMHDNKNTTLVDFKTGGLPSKEDIALGYACQLPLEVLIANKGSINGLTTPLDIRELEYWKLSGSKDKSEIFSFTEKKLDIVTLAQEAGQGVVQLLAAFSSEKQPYYSCPVEEKKPRYNDYEHLARVAEWSGNDKE